MMNIQSKIKTYERLVESYCEVLFDTDITIYQYENISSEKQIMMNIYVGSIEVLKNAKERAHNDNITYEPLIEEVGGYFLFNDHGVLAKKRRTKHVRGTGFREYGIMSALGWANGMVARNDRTRFPITFGGRGIVVPCKTRSDLSVRDSSFINRRVSDTFVRYISSEIKRRELTYCGDLFLMLASINWHSKEIKKLSINWMFNDKIFNTLCDLEKELNSYTRGRSVAVHGRQILFEVVPGVSDVRGLVLVVRELKSSVLVSAERSIPDKLKKAQNFSHDCKILTEVLRKFLVAGRCFMNKDVLFRMWYGSRFGHELKRKRGQHFINVATYLPCMPNVALESMG